MKSLFNYDYCLFGYSTIKILKFILDLHNTLLSAIMRILTMNRKFIPLIPLNSLNTFVKTRGIDKPKHEVKLHTQIPFGIKLCNSSPNLDQMQEFAKQGKIPLHTVDSCSLNHVETNHGVVIHNYRVVGLDEAHPSHISSEIEDVIYTAGDFEAVIHDP